MILFWNDIKDFKGRRDFISRIIVVDEFKKINSIKTKDKVMLWGHNQFGLEFLRFDSQYENIENSKHNNFILAMRAIKL